MIVCVSINPALDRRLVLSTLKLGAVNRAHSAEGTPGGKAAHVALAARSLGARVRFVGFLGDATFQCLYWGMFMFALGNGFCETAINPLVANLYPERKTHYLNVLHAGWPGGLISGGLLGKALFVLRFFAGPIVERISPVGLLCGSSLLGAVGLMLLGSFKSAGMVWLAVTIYGLGKTFLWPTMLGVVGERFPRGGAVTMGAVSAVAALSAGFLGGPGIGYQQDRAASTQLAAEAPATYGRYAAAQDSQFLGFEPVRGLDPKKLGVLLESVPATTLNSDWQIASRARDVPSSLSELKRWWDQTGRPHLDVDRSPLERARVHGGQVALRQTALIPLLMCLGFLVLVLHFRSRGGYRAVRLEDAHAESSRLAAASGAARRSRS